jgi:phenylpyruvate tautomerase PptA (4-oxalocrotonate tautomerase family)
MPNVRIEVRRGWVGARRGAVIDAVHAAMVEAIRIPVWDRTLRLVEHDAEDFATPPGRGERYTLVEITLFAGRSPEARRALYRAIVRNLGALGVPALDIKTVLIEVPAENWGVRGGSAASDIDLGFEVKV